MSAGAARVLFFASLRDATGCDELTLHFDEPLALPELLERLADRLPASALVDLQAENVRVAVNQTFLTGPTLIKPGDEIAFMPPVTGG